MQLFAFYTNELIENLDKETDSIYNQVQLVFIGRHILLYCFLLVDSFINKRSSSRRISSENGNVREKNYK